jgi:hypothetical protein
VRYCVYGYEDEYICDFGMVLALEVAIGLIPQDCWICFSREKMVEFSLSHAQKSINDFEHLFIGQD